MNDVTGQNTKLSCDSEKLSDARLRWVSADMEHHRLKAGFYQNCMHVHRSLRPVVKATAKADRIFFF